MEETAALILSVLADIEPLMQAAFDSVGGTAPPGSSLDQVFLLNGREVVGDYLGPRRVRNCLRSSRVHDHGTAAPNQ